MGSDHQDSSHGRPLDGRHHDGGHTDGDRGRHCSSSTIPRAAAQGLAELDVFRAARAGAPAWGDRRRGGRVAASALIRPYVRSMERITLSDGRSLEYLVDGPADGLPLVLHHGTPSGAVRYRPIVEEATARGLRMLMYSRPGYAESTPHPGRRVADVAPDVAALLDAIGADKFVTVGWSGGGPHALACAALLPGRCVGAATLAGVAPHDAAGLDWPAGMGAENIAEFGAAARGATELDAFLTSMAGDLAEVTGAAVVEAYGDLLSEVDRKALTGAFADYLAASSRHALSAGIAGWREDDLAFVADWGFRLDDLRVPVAIWQGDQDRMVPPGHGRWLAANVAGAEAHLLPGEGHLSLVTEFPAVIEGLLKHAVR
jgi:pimeloyl-ACP methyl ester carboxylesterase